MKEVSISEFKAKCVALLGQVQKIKQSLRVTRFGKAVAEVIPCSVEASTDWIGSMRDEIEIFGDIVSHTDAEDQWEVLLD